jgi:hypothetical protein
MSGNARGHCLHLGSVKARRGGRWETATGIPVDSHYTQPGDVHGQALGGWNSGDFADRFRVSDLVAHVSREQDKHWCAQITGTELNICLARSQAVTGTVTHSNAMSERHFSDRIIGGRRCNRSLPEQLARRYCPYT